jgi:hypothetical protein
MGDAGEMLVAAELTLAGVPALKAPDFRPGYDVVAQPIEAGSKPLRISVKTRTTNGKANLIRYYDTEEFDWLAIVILPDNYLDRDRRRFFILPRDIADNRAATTTHNGKPARCFWIRNSESLRGLADYEANFELNPLGNSDPAVAD